jgi:hypothetical protein
MASVHDVPDILVRDSVNAVESDKLPVWADEVGTDLVRLRRLAPNWDGYGAPVIDPSIIDAARSFVAGLRTTSPIPPRVVPMSGGALQLEWHDGPRSLELEFESPDSIRYLQWDPEAQVEHEDRFPVGDRSKSAALIEWFLSKESR